MSVHRRGNSWFVKYRDFRGKQVQRHFGTGQAAKSNAEEFHLEILLSKKRKSPLTSEIESTMKLKELYDIYMKDYTNKGNSPSQIRNLNYFFENKVFKLLLNKSIDRLTYDDMLDFADKHKDLSTSTRSRHFMYLRAVFNFGIKHGYSKKNPLKNWNKAKEVPKQFEITDEDLSKILKHSPEHLKLAILLAYNCGLRPGESELYALKWTNVDFEERMLNVYGRKTKKYRKVPIPDSFIRKLELAKKISKSEYVIEYHGKPVKCLKHSLESAVKAAGVTCDFRLYDLRHIYATKMLNKGADLAAVSSNLGHSSINVTANVYYQTMSHEKVRAANLLPELTERGPAKTRPIKGGALPTDATLPRKKKKKHKIKDVGTIRYD